MGIINVLDSSVYNRIAAGEVVERPASVVKEIFENSIDSGAKNITVEIARGGKHIRVTDDGCGIANDDLRTAFLPHATSKIHELKDLDAIGTLGFRGEALPSIASVAKVTMVSRRAEDDLGGELIIENGKELSFGSKGAPKGTSVTVDDLFANVPARLKFLRPDRSEEGEITSLMQRLMIANFTISVTYIVNGKVVYATDGTDLKQALYAVYGANFLKETEYIHSTSPDITLFGYVNKPAFSRHNRSYQTLIVNGRYVQNSDISFWVYNCFSDYLMKRQYPAYVIFIDIPEDMVDINVHPSKMEVKFVNIDRIRRMLSGAIAEALTHAVAQPKPIELNVPDSATQKEDDGNRIAENKQNANEVVTDPERHETNATAETVDHGAMPAKRYAADSAYPKSNPLFGDTSVLRQPTPAETGISVTPQPMPKAHQYELFHDIIADKSGIKKEDDFYSSLNKGAYRGKLFETYLLFEIGDDAIMIDQHAAHEKILYDEFSAAVSGGSNTVQDLLIPYIFDVDAREAALIEENMSDLSALGFSVNRLSGNSFSLSAVPLILSDIKLKDFVALLVELLKRGRLGKSAFLKEELMQRACKAAVKGNTDLTDDEIDHLIADIKEKKIDLFCPHGRPLAIRIKRSEIEKWFKRIV